YSLFVQSNRLQSEASMEQLTNSYLDMLCIYNHDNQQ
ncbi:TetR/AcrR family transcriptional regulator, partial [Vibrio genomosp. F10]